MATINEKMSSSMSAENLRDFIEQFNANEDKSIMNICVPQLLHKIAESYPEKTAVICGETELTYRKLHALANRFARALMKRGIGRGDVVGVALNRSTDLVVVLVAVLKSGAAYVPIDPALPSARVAQILDNATPKVVVASANTKEIFSGWSGECLSFEDSEGRSDSTSESPAEDDNNDDEHPSVPIQPSDLAYIMYTSGSTGTPKGVEICHSSVSNFLLSMHRIPGCEPSDRLLAISTISFDMALYEIFTPLTCGATVVLTQTNQSRDPQQLLSLISRHEITMMLATPTTWQMILDVGWQPSQSWMKQLMCGGEALPRRLAEKLMTYSENVWNKYGPTEGTACASVWRVPKGFEEMLVGEPVTNARLYVLDDDGNPAPPGCPGELYIGGAGVARGYRGKPELTQQRFLDDPFRPGERMYKTGDLACFLESGGLAVIGRADDQVKIRGYRIELGDVEAAVAGHPMISGAAVVARDGRLIAYCVMESKEKTEQGFETWLRPWLAEKLPAYMVPTFFVELETFPMTFNGKIDRKALPKHFSQTKETVDEPMSDVEKQVHAVWSKIIGHDQIGTEDNFFQVGGDSARVVRVQAELQRITGRKVSVAKLFEHYTVKTQAEYLMGLESPNGSSVSRSLSLPEGDEPIAIVSMACHLPGNVETPQEYWELLVGGRHATIDIPKDRWDADAFYDPNPNARGKSYCRSGGFISSIDSFDPVFFGMSPRESRAVDPLQRLMLETSWEALERAGCTTDQLRGSQTGVFIGISNVPAHHAQEHAIDLADLEGYGGTGSAGATVSGRISYILGLEGPCLTVDTACSSSLVSTHLACEALRRGECNMAVSGGVSLLTPAMLVEFSRLGAISADGICRSFSADTQGVGFSEGVAAVVLKRLSDAQRDGDTVHAVLRGTAVNHGGRSSGLTAPSGSAQQRVIHAALAASHLEPNDVGYIEAHGTGTTLGDPIEGEALAEVFGSSRSKLAEPLYIGTSKSNIGHAQAAAGLAGVLKVVMALKHDILPQSLHITKPTPAVNWQGANMIPVMENRPWLASGNGLRRAGVSAFGIGGTNAHVVVEEAPMPPTPTSCVAQSPPVSLLTISAHTSEALRQQASNLRSHLMSNPSRLIDTAYTLATKRSHFPHRLTLLAKDEPALFTKLDNISLPSPSNQSSAPHIAMLFTGQGSQTPLMGQTLSKSYPAFHSMLQVIASKFAAYLDHSLLDVMWAPAESPLASLLSQTLYAQPALFSLSVALHHLWSSWGVFPEIVAGHSIGELAAAYVAGVMDLDDACRLVAARGRMMHKIPDRGGKMASLEGSREEVIAQIEKLGLSGQVEVAAGNSPTQTVVSGCGDGVEEMVTTFVNIGKRAKKLATERAFHSHHMDEMLEEFRKVVETITFEAPKIGIVSTVTGLLVADDMMEKASYWVEQVRREVKFSDCMSTLRKKGINVFLESGPRPVLCGLGAECMEGRGGEKMAFLPSITPGKDETETILSSLGEMHMRRVPIQWAGYFAPFDCRPVELPTYAFQRQPMKLNPASVTAKPASTTVVKLDDQSRGKAHPTFKIDWDPVDSGGATHVGKWGLLCPTAGVELAEKVTTSLSQAGVQVSPVGCLEDAEHLDGLLCLWDPSDDVPSQSTHLAEIALTQLQTAAKIQFTSPIVWLTRQAVSVGRNNHAAGLGASSLWGLMRTARNEHPELCMRMIDLADDTDTTALSGLSAALGLTNEPECMIRHDQVLVPRMRRVNSVSSPIMQNKLRTDGAVLITGGLGDLGRHVALWLASQHGIRDLVLTSRRGMETPGAEAFVAELAKLGAKAVVVAGDIADRDSVRSLMTLFDDERPLRGVVHAAGVPDAGVLTTLRPERIAYTFAPKVAGAWYLHQMTTEMDLDMFILFSSISGVMGMPGLGIYAAANGFLDSLANVRRNLGLPATSVAYGPFEGGMATDMLHSTRSHLAQFGLDMMKPSYATDWLEEAVHSGRSLTIAAELDMVRFEQYHEDQGGMPALFSSLATTTTKRVVDHGGDLRRELSNVSPDQHMDICLRMVKEVAAKALGIADPNDVDIHRPLQEIGLDSLTAILTRNQLAALTGLTLSANIIFLNPNLESLSQSILSQMHITRADTPSSESNSGTMTPATSISESSACIDVSAMRKGALDSAFTFDNATQDSTPPAAPRSVFVTGATGFVGGFIVRELLERGITTYCLVRASDVDHARQRIIDILKTYDLWKDSYNSLLMPIAGDAGQFQLGLADDVFDDLAENVDSICHAAGLVDWMRPLDDYVQPNIISTHEVLRLASQGRSKTIHFVSTVATLPWHSGINMSEDMYEYNYATSKWTAERLVSAARWRGANASIYRLPFVTASASTGHFRLDRGDFLHNLIVGSDEMGKFPLIDSNLSIVLPVDYLCKTIVVAMTEELSRINTDYDFANVQAPSFYEYFQLFNKPGAKSNIVPFANWREEALAYAMANPRSALARIAPVLDDCTDENAAAMFDSPPIGRHVFGYREHPAPVMDHETIGRYLDRIHTLAPEDR